MTADQLLRKTEGEAEKPVGFVELFFDLVFVFAITQVTTTLTDDLTPIGFLHTAILLLVTWWSWINTTLVTNWLEPERWPVRMMVFALMGIGLLQAAVLPDAFARHGGIFAACAVATQTLRGGFTLYVLTRAKDPNRANYLRLVAWMALSLPLWIVGAWATPEARLWWWGAAVAAEYLGPVMRYRLPGLGKREGELNLDGAHLSERCALFIIIALGEAVISTGSTFAEGQVEPATGGALLVAFVGAVALWWVYFHVGAKRADEVMDDAEQPGWLARNSFTYLHVPIVASLVVSAVADEKSIAEPFEQADRAFTFLAAGGTALFLAGTALFKKTLAESRRTPVSHLVGLVLCGALMLLSPALPQVGVNALVVAILILVAVLEHVRRDEPTQHDEDPTKTVAIEH